MMMMWYGDVAMIKMIAIVVFWIKVWDVDDDDDGTWTTMQA
jgi:hypothetical protein